MRYIFTILTIITLASCADTSYIATKYPDGTVVTVNVVRDEVIDGLSVIAFTSESYTVTDILTTPPWRRCDLVLVNNGKVLVRFKEGEWRDYIVYKSTPANPQSTQAEAPPSEPTPRE